MLNVRSFNNQEEREDKDSLASEMLEQNLLQKSKLLKNENQLLKFTIFKT